MTKETHICYLKATFRTMAIVHLTQASQIVNLVHCVQNLLNEEQL